MHAFLIWEHCLTRDHVLSFIYTHTDVHIPDFPSREEYVEWLGSFNHIRLVIVAYDILRRARPLFRLAFHLLIDLQ